MDRRFPPLDETGPCSHSSCDQTARMSSAVHRDDERLANGRLVTGPTVLLYHGSMARQSMIRKKKRGPPATGKGTPIMVRLQPSQLASVDAWIANMKAT